MNIFKMFGKIVIDSGDAEKKIDGVVDTAKGADGKMKKSFGSIGRSVRNGFTVAGAALFEKKIVQTYSTYDDQMRKVQAVTGATGKTYEKLKGRAEDLGKKTRYSATEAGKGMESLGRAGWDADQIMAGIGQTLDFATANSMDLGEASEIVADGLSQFNMEAEEAGKFTDVLSATAKNSNTDIGKLGESLKYVGPVAGALGYSLEDTSVALGLMANQGIKSSQAGTSLKNIMTNLTKPTKESKAAMEDLGLSVTDANGDMKPFSQILGDLRGSFKNLTPEQKAQYAASLAGKEGMSGLLALVSASPEEFDSMTGAIKDSEGVTKEMADTMDGGLGGAMASVKSAWENVLLQFGKTQDQLLVDGLELISKALQKVADTIPKMKEKFDQMKQFIKDNEKWIQVLVAAFGALVFSMKIGGVVGGVKGKLMELGGSFVGLLSSISPANLIIAIFAGLAMLIYKNWDTIGPWLADLWEKIKGVFQKGVDFVEHLIETYWKPIAEAAVKAWEFAGDLIKFIWELIKGIIETAITIITAVVKTYLNIIKAIWENVWNIISAIVKGVWDVISRVISKALEVIKKVIGTVMNAIKKVIEGIWKTISGITRKTWDGIKKIIETITGVINRIIKAIFDKIWKHIDYVWKKVSGVTKTIWEGIRRIIETITGTIRNIFKKVFDAIFGVVSKVWDSIRDKTSGVWNNIKGVIERIVNAIKNVVESVFQTIKRIIEGVWNSIRDTTSRIWEGIKNTVSRIIENIKNTISRVFDGIKNIASNAWNRVYNSMTRPVEAARNTIRKALDSIKGFFSRLRLKLPKIERPKLPKFTIKGGFSFKPPSVPKLGLSWFKEGGILTDATIFGMSGGNLLGGGEAGAEAVLPIEKLSGILANTMDDLGYGEKRGSGDIYVEVKIDNFINQDDMSLRELVEKIKFEIKREQKGYGGAY